jgi:hypothetical protein
MVIARQPGLAGRNPVLADHAAGTGYDSAPSMAGVDSGYLRLESGSRWVAPWRH